GMTKVVAQQVEDHARPIEVADRDVARSLHPKVDVGVDLGGPVELITEEQRAQQDGEVAAHRHPAELRAGRRGEVGEGAEQDGEGDEGQDEAGHCLAPPALRRFLWIRFMLPASKLPWPSSLKRKAVVSWPSKASLTSDCRISWTWPLPSCSETRIWAGT